MTNEEAIKQLSLIIASQGRIFETQSGASCRAIFHAINAMNARKHGEWLNKEVQPNYTVIGTCSNCHERTRIGYFCRICGADMRDADTEVKNNET